MNTTHDWEKIISDNFTNGTTVPEFMEYAYRLGVSEADAKICEYETALRKNANLIVTHSMNEILDKTYDQVSGVI